MASNEGQRQEYFFGLKPHEGIVQGHATRTAENQCQYMLPTLQQMVAAKPDLKLLDVGCGPGTITASLARYVPEGSVVGVDLSDTVLEKARQLVKDERLNHVSIQSADVYSLPFEDETFDVVHTHQAVVHFHEHVRAVKELLRVLKKGGVLCMREVDLYSARFYPNSPILEDCIRTVISLHESRGAGPDAGRRLKAWTMAAGVPRDNITMTGGAWCYNTAKQKKSFNGRDLFKDPTGQKAIDCGFVTRERIQEFEEAWSLWAEDDEGLLMLMNGQVIAQKT